MRTVLKTGYFISLILAIHCRSYSIENPHGSVPLILESAGVECKEVKRFPQWYLLYGTYPINGIKPGEMFSAKGKSYRIYHEATYVDAAISALGGLALSLTRKTIRVEQCEPSTTIVSSNELEKQIRQAVEAERKECEIKIEELEKGESEMKSQSDPETEAEIKQADDSKEGE